MALRFILLVLLGPSFLYAGSSLQRQMEDKFPAELKELGPSAFAAVVRMIEYGTRVGDSPVISNGRLTLTTATPITTADVTAATTVYFTPYNGNRISLYSSSRWQLFTFSEISVAVPATTSKPFDVFAYDNSGTVALTTVNWTDGATRATALTTQDGVQVLSSDATRRYLGTAQTTGVSGQTEDSLQNRLLWNYYNQVPRQMYYAAGASSHSYATATNRPYNNDASAKLSLVLGLGGMPLTLSIGGTMQPATAGGVPNIAFCIDGTACGSNIAMTNGTTNTVGSGYSETNSLSSVGSHYVTLTEYGAGVVGGTTFNYGILEALIQN